MGLNGIMFQGFHWYLDKDNTINNSKSLWATLKDEAGSLKSAGIDAIWLPPPCKAGGPDSSGYDVYDHYDLGEFKVGTDPARTKYGTKDELLAAVKELHSNNIQVYMDVVMNHLDHGKLEDTYWQAIRTEKGNRTVERWEGFEGGIIDIMGYTHFDYKERNNKYSDFRWRVHHFDGIEWVEKIRQKNTEFTKQQVEAEREKGYIYRFLYNEPGYQPAEKSFDEWVSLEKGNYDYLMCCDLDFGRYDVREQMKKWGTWLTRELDIDGFRIDAVKHINADYLREWLGHVRHETGKHNAFVVMEYYTMHNLQEYHDFINRITNYGSYPQEITVFDFILKTKFRDASYAFENYDLRELNYNTLTATRPTRAVTFVENHDKQFGRDMDSHVQYWFKPLAYAYILLREQGYPCVFMADYYGSDARDSHIGQPSGREFLDLLMKLRKQFALGEERYYTGQDKNIIGWIRMGFVPHAKGCMAVVLNNGNGIRAVSMDTGRKNKRFYHFITIKYVNDKYLVVKYRYELYGDKSRELYTDNNGWGSFLADGRTVSVWIEEGIGLT